MSKKLTLPSKSFEEAVGAIIERDFYPDLPLLRQQLYWLEALHSGDADRISLARQHVTTSIRRAESLVAAAASSAAPTPLLINNGRRELEEEEEEEGKKESRDVADREEASSVNNNKSLKRGKRRRSAEDDTSSLISWTAELQGGGGGGGRGGVVLLDRKMRRQGGGFATHMDATNMDEEDDPTSVVDSIIIDPRGHYGVSDTSAACDSAIDSLPLNNFLNTFESEDTTSFTSNMNKETGERMRSHWWAHAPVDSRMRQIMMAEGTSNRAAPSGADLLLLQQQSSTEQQLLLENTDKHRHSRRLLENDAGGTTSSQLITTSSSTALDKMRDPHGLQRFWKHKTRNNLFFMPSDVATKDAIKEDGVSTSELLGEKKNEEGVGTINKNPGGGGILRKRETRIGGETRRIAAQTLSPPLPLLHRPGVGPGGYEYVDTPLFLQGVPSNNPSQKATHTSSDDPSDEAITSALGLSTSSSTSTSVTRQFLSGSGRVFAISSERPREILRNKLIERMVTSSSASSASSSSMRRTTAFPRHLGSTTSTTRGAIVSRTPLFASASTPSLLQPRPLQTRPSLDAGRGQQIVAADVDDDGAASVHGSVHGSVRTTRSNLSSVSTRRTQLNALPPAQRAVAMRVAAAAQERRRGQSSGGDFSGIF